MAATKEGTKQAGEIELACYGNDENPNCIVHPDDNREPPDVSTAAIDLNAEIGVVVDMNGTKPDHRGDNLEENEAAQAALDAATSGAETKDVPDPDEETWDPNGINNPHSVYFRPPLDFKDPPDLEQSEPPPEPVILPPLETGLLRRADEE